MDGYLILLGQIQAERNVADVFSGIVRVPPLWWYGRSDEWGDRCCHLLPRDPTWLRVELPCLIVRMRRRALRIVHDPDDADDAVSLALLKTEREPYLPQDVEAYLLSAVKNAALDILRSRARSASGVWKEIQDDPPPPEEQSIRAEEAGILGAALSGLDPIERDAIQFHYFKHLSIKETAERLSAEVYEAQNVLARARSKLRKILASKLIVSTPSARRRGSHARPPRSTQLSLRDAM
jgi:RNA polymerase sigma factor (sigma-70 family)